MGHCVDVVARTTLTDSTPCSASLLRISRSWIEFRSRIIAQPSPYSQHRSVRTSATWSISRVSRPHRRSLYCDSLCPTATCVDDEEADPHDAGWRAAL
jgi:hypothetical protein